MLTVHDQKFDRQTIDDVFPGIHKNFEHKRHDEPCPKQTVDDISQCPEVNEWVLNHLPLNEEQKQWLIKQLHNDKLKQEKAEKNKRWRLLSKSVKQKEEKGRQHVSIKESTKAAQLQDGQTKNGTRVELQTESDQGGRTLEPGPVVGSERENVI